MKTRMFVRQMKSIGFVDQGACEGADILIAKRGDSLPTEVATKMDEVAQTFAEVAATDELREDLYEITNQLRESLCSIISDPTADKPVMTQQSLAEFVAALMPMLTAAKAGRVISAANLTKINTALDSLKAALASLSTLMTAASGGEDTTMADKKFEDLEKRAADAEAAIAAKDAEIEALKARIPADPEEALKALPESVRKRLDDAEKMAREERDLRVTGEFVAKCKSLHGLPAKAEEFGVVLKRICENAGTDADRAELDRVLKALCEQVAKSALVTELGTVGGDKGDSAVEKINAKARELVTKGEHSTFELAFAHVLKTDTDLNKALRAERAAGH